MKAPLKTGKATPPETDETLASLLEQMRVVYERLNSAAQRKVSSEEELARRIVEFKPSAYYFRTALRRASTKEEVFNIGMQAVRELHATQTWMREEGIEPPMQFILASEAEAKNLRLYEFDEARAQNIPVDAMEEEMSALDRLALPENRASNGASGPEPRGGKGRTPPRTA